MPSAEQVAGMAEAILHLSEASGKSVEEAGRILRDATSVTPFGYQVWYITAQGTRTLVAESMLETYTLEQARALRKKLEKEDRHLRSVAVTWSYRIVGLVEQPDE